MSNQAKHTPGPWTFAEDNDAGVHHDGGRWIRTNGLFSIRVIGGDFVSRHQPRIEDAERDANARLIAAAPDLLAALNQIASDDRTPSNIAAIARVALSKARGE